MAQRCKLEDVLDKGKRYFYIFMLAATPRADMFVVLP